MLSQIFSSNWQIVLSLLDIREHLNMSSFSKYPSTFMIISVGKFTNWTSVVAIFNCLLEIFLVDWNLSSFFVSATLTVSRNVCNTLTVCRVCLFVCNLELVSKELLHFGGIVLFFQDWAPGHCTDRWRINLCLCLMFMHHLSVSLVPSIRKTTRSPPKWFNSLATYSTVTVKLRLIKDSYRYGRNTPHWSLKIWNQ